MEWQFRSALSKSSFTRLLSVRIATACLVLATPPAHAARPTQAELSESALQAEIGPSTKAELEERVRAAKERLRGKETKQPSVVSYASTVFRHGMTEADLQHFAESHGVEISRAEAKVPVDDAGIVFTISIGSREILLRDGKFSERLKKAMGHQRLQFLDTARASADEAEKQRFMTAAHALPILYYKVECVGQHRALADIGRDENVAVVFVREGNADVLSYNAFKEMFTSWRQDSPPSIRVVGRPGKPPLNDPKVDPNTPILKAP